MADPQVIQCAAACTVTVVHSLPLLEITVEEGAQIAGAVLAVWAIGWGFRVLVRVLKNTDGISSTSED